MLSVWWVNTLLMLALHCTIPTMEWISIYKFELNFNEKHNKNIQFQLKINFWLTSSSSIPSHHDRSRCLRNGQLIDERADKLCDEQPAIESPMRFGSRAISHDNCFLEMFVHDKFKCWGWRRTIPIKQDEVIFFLVKSIDRHSWGSQHHRFHNLQTNIQFNISEIESGLGECI